MTKATAIAALAPVIAVALACSTPRKTGSAEVLLNERMAAVLLHEGRVAEAERAYRDVLPSDPKNPEVHDGLGVALLFQGKFKDAHNSFDKAVDLDSSKMLYRIHRGMASLELGKFKDAEEDFAAAEGSVSPDDRLDAAIHRGRLKTRQKEFAAAEEAFTLALSRNPKSTTALIGRGVARESRGSLEAAAADYLEACRLEPTNAEAHLRLGLALVTLKKDALGRRYLERTIQLDPSGELGARARLLLEGKEGSTPRS